VRGRVFVYGRGGACPLGRNLLYQGRSGR
jgi:hypothetical protein